MKIASIVKYKTYRYPTIENIIIRSIDTEMTYIEIKTRNKDWIHFEQQCGLITDLDQFRRHKLDRFYLILKYVHKYDKYIAHRYYNYY